MGSHFLRPHLNGYTSIAKPIIEGYLVTFHSLNNIPSYEFDVFWTNSPFFREQNYTEYLVIILNPFKCSFTYKMQLAYLYLHPFYLLT